MRFCFARWVPSGHADGFRWGLKQLHHHGDTGVAELAVLSTARRDMASCVCQVSTFPRVTSTTLGPTRSSGMTPIIKSHVFVNRWASCSNAGWLSGPVQQPSGRRGAYRLLSPLLHCPGTNSTQRWPPSRKIISAPYENDQPELCINK